MRTRAVPLSRKSTGKALPGGTGSLSPPARGCPGQCTSLELWLLGELQQETLGDKEKRIWGKGAKTATAPENSLG